MTEKKRVIFPLDNELGMPQGKYSYKLQDWIGYGATDTDFRSSVKLLNRVLGQTFSEMQSQRITNDLSAEVEEFYDGAILPDKKEEGEYFAAGFDDKGIPILPSEVNREVDSSGERLGKGQKNGVKKSSTVSVTYSFDPFVRTPGKVISNLFDKHKEEKKEKKPQESARDTQNKHIRAFLSDKDRAIEYGFDNILKRGGEAPKIVALIDGDRGLEKAIDRVVERKGITTMIIGKILDFIHVVEYIWKAANAHFGEKSPKRMDWVKQQCLLLLQSQTDTVIDNLQALVQQNKSKPKQDAIQKVINYIVNHKHMMDYRMYLARGFPISTGAVESACGHFVQCRMERNGMRWSLKGAQNLLNLRAVNKNDDWDKYIKHYIDKEQALLSGDYRIAA